MSPIDGEEAEVTGPERRVDGPVAVIDEAVVLASIEGVGDAIEHMERAGVNRPTALRVLSGPEYHREPDGGTIARVLDFITNHFRRRSRR